MKKSTPFILITLLLSPLIAEAEYYTVNVKRVDQNLYKVTTANVYIQTKFCYEYTYGDDAILKYDRYGYDNKLVFSNSTSCDVDKIL